MHDEIPSARRRPRLLIAAAYSLASAAIKYGKRGAGGKRGHRLGEKMVHEQWLASPTDCGAGGASQLSLAFISYWLMMRWPTGPDDASPPLDLTPVRLGEPSSFIHQKSTDRLWYLCTTAQTPPRLVPLHARARATRAYTARARANQQPARDATDARATAALPPGSSPACTLRYRTRWRRQQCTNTHCAYQPATGRPYRALPLSGTYSTYR